MGNKLLNFRPFFTLLVALSLAVLISSSSPAASEAAGLGGETIARIEWRLDGELGRSIDLASTLGLQPGETVTESAIRRALSNLHATGLIESAEIYRRRSGNAGEVVLVVVLRPLTWVTEVAFAGQPALPKNALMKVVVQQAYGPLREDLVELSRERLLELHSERGYREAVVGARLESRSASKRAVIFHVDSGPRARLGSIGFEGPLAELDPAELRRVSRLESGDEYRQQAVADALDRLREWLSARGYLSARVDGPREVYDSRRQQIDLVYEIAPGPRIEVEVTGAEYEKLRKKGFFSYLDEQTYDEALIAQIGERLRTYFQRQGHYFAQVDHRSERRPGHIRLQIDIEPGPIRSLGAIDFEGNQTFSDDQLAELMKTSVRRPFKRDSGRLVDEELEADLANLQSFYVLQGFSQAIVGPPRIEDLGDELKLVIEIRPGVRKRVVAIDFTGLEHLGSDELIAALPIEPGGPYHPVLLSAAINTIRTLYEEQGYAAVAVTPHLDWNDAETLVDIRFEIHQGTRQVVDRIFLRGHRQTREETIRRFITLEKGEPIHRRRLLEVERDLYRLGIFSRVEVELLPITDRPHQRDVLVRVEEGRRWRLAYGFSYHSDDGPGGLLTVSRNNIGGRADRLQLDLRGNASDARFRLLFDQPALGPWNLPITYSLFRQRDERESFTIDDLGAQVSVTRDFRTLRLGLIYDYRQVDLSVDALDPSQIERQDRELEISSLTPTLLIDRRDDPLEPSTGWSTTLQLEVAFPLLQAETEFAKFFWQQTQFFDSGSFGVLGASFRLGAIEPLDPRAEPDILIPSDLPSRLIPASERFFAGGRTTHRAYRRDRLGIPGQTLIDFDGESIEVGGNGLLLLNLDYRFPIAGPFGGTLFADFGNVWAGWQDIDPSDMRLGVGIGVRYRSAIGPLRLDIGWPLDRLPGERSPVFFFSFGNPF